MMKKIVIEKLDKTELTVLQREIQLFAMSHCNHIHNCDLTTFLNSIMAVDLSFNLWALLQKRIEKETIITTLKLTPSQGAVIFKACQSKYYERDEYANYLMLKISGIIDQQLKSII